MIIHRKINGYLYPGINNCKKQELSTGKLLTTLTLLLITGICVGQDHYYFKKWKSKQAFSEKLIVFQVDTALTRDQAHPLILVIDRTSTHLKPHGFDFEIIPYPSDTIIDKETLMLKFEKLPDAYVKLRGNSKLPLCSRMRVSQPNSKEKKRIETEIAISVPGFEQGLEQLSAELAKRLKSHFILKEE